ncbi:hypothetical protein [Rhodococcus sp. NCIMB 12038]|uniref:hypothetical protein n=1 Tax=Rhodococcus sp. NCIMB 12038 TaxID=933800 RepID=UPI000B3C846B|nr:hypothetical protein [Rhodococcus sp. NCIMB 12038]OUS97236.1 hypothetical protein CA951_02505 [Rhodococcus sp. NCIMB 12038]
MIDDIDFFSDDLTDFDTAVIDEPDTTHGKGLKSTFGKVVGEARSRLSRGDGSGDQLNPDARLSSVVSESTPGAALELLRLNKPFALTELNAYVMLVLPTVGDFGGLSRRSKDEARGTIINLIAADNIHAIVTAELLADDALGIVPDPESLARMEEISLLTEARYLYGVACEDVDTGEVKVFSVPPISEETAVSGNLFGQACEISRGEIDLTSVLDPSLIAAMLAIYRSAEDAISGAAALTKAEDMNMEYLVKAVSQGGYPTAAELVANLATEFSALAGHTDSAADESVPADESTGTTEEESGPFGTGDEDAEDAEAFDADEAVFPDDGDFELELHDDHPDFDDDSDDPGFSDAVTESEPAGDSDEPDFGTAGTAPRDTEVPASVAEAIARVTGERIDALRSDLGGLLEQIQSSLVPAQRLTEAGLPIVDGADRSVPITVEPGSEFTYNQALEAAGRAYTNDDLGLVVDARPFKELLVSPVPQVPAPQGSFTPWLGEQAAAMTAVFNEQLRKLHVDNEQMLYRQFMHMADLAAKEISWEFDPLRNPDSRWGRVYSAIQSDREKIAERAAPAKLRAEEAVRELWNSRAELYVSDAAARARQEYEHRHGTHIEADVRNAGEQVLAELEALSAANLVELNESRGVSARLQMDEKISDILHSLVGKAAEQQANEAAAFEAALAAVTAYIEENRKNDLLQSDVSARKLETDARYEQLMSETTAQIAAARTEADARIAAMMAEMQQQTESHQRGMELRTRNFEIERSNHEQREQDLRRRLEQSLADRESEQRELMMRADARVEMAEKARDEAITDKELLRERDARMTTAAVVLIVLGAIVLVSLGILAGAFLI